MNACVHEGHSECGVHKVVVLGLYYTGYGVIREFSAMNMPVYVFDEALRWPERVTRLAKYCAVNNDRDLLKKLIEFAENEPNKPVLYLTSDFYVEYFMKHRGTLEDHYLIDFPESDVADMLLKKGRFAEFAVEHGYKIPRTAIIRSFEDYERCSGDIVFPCVVKPFCRSKAWLRAKLKKVYLCAKKSELERCLDYLSNVESNLIIQQYIPGGDREIYFHLMYYNAQSECVGEFTGRKLRQWPVGTGQTSCAEPAPWATEVQAESRRLFSQLEYKGFGSVEFKRHPVENKFYIMEPTVGRQNAQSFLAAINGVPMSLIGYSALTGNPQPQVSKKTKNTFWVDDQYDPFSILISAFRGCLNIRDVFRSYLGRKKFRLFHLKDYRVSLYCWTVVLVSKLLGKIRRIGRKY